MGKLSVFDIIGPVMVGPSSSHTAGAQKIGLEFRKRLSGRLKSIEVTLYNSFADTGEGHGTKAAVIAGILGISTEDEAMKGSLQTAREQGIRVVFRMGHDSSRHPNSVRIMAETTRGRFFGAGDSIGGGIVDCSGPSLVVADERA